VLGELTILWRSRSLIGSVSYLVHTANAVDVYVRLLLLHRLHFSTGGFKGEGQGSHAPQDARGYEVTLSTKDFSVQFYTKCAV